MTTEDFVNELSKQLSPDLPKTSEILTAAVNVIKEKLSEGACITIESFGIFDTEKKPEYILVKQNEQQQFLVPPKITVVFKPDSAFIEKIKKKEV